MKNQLVYLILILIISGLSINVVFASFSKGDKLEALETSYNAGESLRGWINISLQDEPVSSMLSAFDSNMTILKFLDLNSADYDCLPADCESDYSASGKKANKSLSLAIGKEKIIGFKIEGKTINSISSFSLNIESNAGETRYPQLWIDILNDAENAGEFDWRSYSASGNFAAEVKGCYQEGSQKAEIKDNPYCEKINVPAFSEVEIGANIEPVSGEGGDADFEFRIYNDNYDSSCDINANKTGKISCVVSDFSTDVDQDFFVCITEDDSDDTNDYNINYEQNSPCGFTGEDDSEFTHDFDIFAKAGKFAPVGSFVLNNDEIDNYQGGTSDIEWDIETYLDDRYNMNCENGCIVPVKFRSMSDQSITLSSASLTYTAGVTTTTHDLYDLEETEAIIDMNFTKLYLDNSDLKAPETSGAKDLSLKLNGNLIASKNISVSKGATISYLAPLTLPAAIPVKFIISTSGGNITKYKWDFGDGTEDEETTTNTTTHTYSSIGDYNVEISVTSTGGQSSKTFSVKVTSPKEAINTTLIEKRDNLNSSLRDLEAIAWWYKDELGKKAGLDEIDIALKSLEKKYESASSSDDYVDIMTQLTELRVPYSLNLSSSSSGAFFPNPEQVDPSYVAEIGSEKADNPEGYVNPILTWFNEHLDVQAESKVYSLYYPEGSEPVLSALKLKIKPKEDFSREVYLIIDRPYEEVKFNPEQDYRDKAAGSATGLIFQSLEEGKEEVVEFILSEKIVIIDLPAYLSPEFSQLPESLEIGVCDNDGKCEKSEGENSKNCKNDCKPWEKVIIYIIILLFIAFVVYIILQEWYKRKYENYLFRNRNDLFNLINFISNALNQALNRDGIIKKLEGRGWKKEQIIYAFKKVRGERTGMWEIPIFRFFEQRKIRKEIAKRRQNLG